MPKTIEGTYRAGEIHLSRTPEGIEEARVLVTFLPPDPEPRREPAAQLSFGMFKGGRVTHDEDFRIAEWHGEAGLPDGD